MTDDDPGQREPVFVDLQDPAPTGAQGIIRRVRRIADLSQRELAAILGVSQSTVARWETGQVSPTHEILERMLDLGRLRWVLVDDVGREVPPMAEDRARDRGRRRYPAHLDPYALDWWTPRGADLRSDYIDLWRRARKAQDPGVRYQLRGLWRDLGRRQSGIPEDHPTREGLVTAIHRRTREQGAVRRGDSRGRGPD